MRCRVAERAERVEFADGRLAEQRLHVLRLVHDDDRARGLEVVDRAQAIELVPGLVDDAGVLVATQRVDAHHHDLHAGAGGERLHLLSGRAAVDSGVERLGVEVLEVLAPSA